MKAVFLLATLLVFIGCSKDYKVLENSRIVAKYIVWNEDLSPFKTDCTSKLKSFIKMNKYDCSFKLHNYEFDIKEKFTLNEDGELKEYWVSHSEAPLVYTISDLKADQKYFNYIGANNLKVVLLKNKMEIFDSGNYFVIERVFQNEKLIFVRQKSNLEKEKFRIIFQYE